MKTKFFISTKTRESNLQYIFRKKGILLAQLQASYIQVRKTCRSYSCNFNWRKFEDSQRNMENPPRLVIRNQMLAMLHRTARNGVYNFRAAMRLYHQTFPDRIVPSRQSFRRYGIKKILLYFFLLQLCSLFDLNQQKQKK